MEELEDLFSTEVDNEDIDGEGTDPIITDPLEEGGEGTGKEEDPVAKYLVELGILDEDEDLSDLEVAIKSSKDKADNKAVEALLSRLPEDFKPLLEYGLNGGASLQEYLQANAPIDYDKLDLDDENVQNSVMFNYYKQTSKYSDEKIEKLIARLKDADALKETAEETVAELKQIREEAKSKLIDDQKKQHADYLKEVAKETERFEKSFEEYKAPADRKEKIQKMFTVGKDNKVPFNDTMNTIRSNYDHLLQLSDLLLDYDPKKGFNMDRFIKKAQTEKVSNLRNILEERIQNSKPGGEGRPTKENNFDFEKFISL